MTTAMHPPALMPPREQAPPGVPGHPAAADHLAHQFSTPGQQYEAAKLGMWLFLATELLLFGGLFCVYAVLRHLHPELFAYGSRFLQTRWGMVNTIVLILSSLTMAWAVRSAQLDHRIRLVALLGLTVAGGAAFMGVKYVEYAHKIHENLVWGTTFYEEPRAHLAAAPAEPAAEAGAPAVGDPIKGRALWMGTCRSCHGVGGEGITGQGKDIRGSEFIAGKSDKELIAFIKAGRMPVDKLNTTGVQMPPRGGNPLITDSDLVHIVSFVQTFKAPAPGAEAAAASLQPAVEEEFYIPRSVIPDAPRGPAGLAADWETRWEREPGLISAAEIRPGSLPPDPRRDPDRPANAHLFFGIYFLLTGLHGLHVLAGMGLITWLLVRALLGHFTPAYYTPVDLVGLYWHVVDIIWIFLFPLLYLIHV